MSGRIRRITDVKAGEHGVVFNGTLTVTTLVTGVAVSPTIDKLSET